MLSFLQIRNYAIVESLDLEFSGGFTCVTGETGGGDVRIFITGVSPVTMDDVTSGHNIGKHISLNPRFNEIMGFTEDEVREMAEGARAATASSSAAGCSNRAEPSADARPPTPSAGPTASK